MMSACISMQLLGYSPRICTYTHSWATNSFVLQYFLAMRIQVCFTYPHDHTVFCQIRAYKATQGHHILAVPSQIIYLSKLRKECVTNVVYCIEPHFQAFYREMQVTKEQWLFFSNLTTVPSQKSRCMLLGVGSVGHLQQVHACCWFI